MEINFILILLVFLACIQSILGIGILVLGTPILLLLNFNLPEILELLLPVSIVTSFTTLIFIKHYNKNVFSLVDKKINYYFFSICLPAIFFGLLLLNLYNEIIDFKVLVSIIILFSLLIKYLYKKKIQTVPKNIKKILMFTIGVIHGLTNSGGTILSLFFSNTNKNTLKLARINITYFYLLIAFFQFLIFSFLFNALPKLDQVIVFFIIGMIGSFLGNFIIKLISEELFKYIIELLAIFSALFLLFK